MGMAKFDPRPTLNPEVIVTKFETRDYVADIFFQSFQKFPPTYVKYTPKTFECLLLFSFHPSLYRRARWTDLRA